MFVEHVEHVPFAIQDRDGFPPVEFLHRRNAVTQATQPPPGRALLHRTVRSGGAVRRVELEIDHAQRNPVAAHGEGRVQMQARRPRRALVAPDRTEAFAAVVGREVQVRAILDQKRQPLTLHPPQRPLAMRLDDGGRSNRIVVRMLDHPVVPLYRRLAAGRCCEECLRRRPGLDLCAPDQTLRQPCITQRRRTEFVLRPTRAVKAVPGLQHTPGTQASVPVRRQWPDQDALRRFRNTATKAATGGVADTAPAGRQETAAPVFRCNKGLGQNRTDPVNRREVLAHPPRRHAQNPRGKETDRNRRTDQKSHQTNHPLKMTLTVRIVPAKPDIPRRKRPQRRGKEKTTEPTMWRADQIAKLTTNVKPRTTRMLACHQLVEHQAKIRTGDTDKLKTLDRAGKGRKTLRSRNRLLQTGNPATTPAAPRRRKLDLPVPFKTAKRSEATGDLGLARRIKKAERTADPAANLGTRGTAGSSQNRRQPLHALRRRQGTGYRNKPIHTLPLPQRN